MKKIVLIVFISVLVSLNGCFSTSAVKVDNICYLLDEEVSWYRAIKASEKKYAAPAYVQLAIINQESRFASHAKPPRKKLFGTIPWFRPTTASGFAQVIDGTWEWYQKDSGNTGADRNDFEDAADFVGWYMNQSKKRSKISKTDAYNQYLAYHEGHGGFNKKSYKAKPWLIKIAKRVDENSKLYQKQLKQCTNSLDKNRIWRIF